MADRVQTAWTIAEAAWDAGMAGGWRRGVATGLRAIRHVIAPALEAAPVPPPPEVPAPVPTPPREPAPSAALVTPPPVVEPDPVVPASAWVVPDLSAAEPEASPLHDEVIARIQTVFDPEIPVNIYELGLIYGVAIDEGAVRVEMTLTSPNCPSAQSLPDEVRTKIADLDGVSTVDVEVVWDPPWGPERMSEEARLELNLG